MGKVNKKELRSIQKKALKEVKHNPESLSKNKLSDEGIILMVHEKMGELLQTDTFVYQGLERHKHTRYPKIRPLSKKR